MDLALRQTAESDLQQVVELESDPDVMPWITLWPLERHLRAISDQELAHLTYFDARDGCFAGFLLLAGLRDPARSLELRRIALRARGGGLGGPAIELALAYAVEHCRARRVWLDLLPWNERAGTVYRRAGFSDEGLVEGAHPLPDGSFAPLRIMSISTERWLAARAAPHVS